MERSVILSRIQSILGDRSRPGLLDGTQVFCIEDGEPIPRGSWRPDWFEHEGHGNQRAFLFDPTMKWEFRQDGEVRHFSAGAILWRPEPGGDRYCLFRRRRYPVGYYTIPAGHIEMGEEPQESALREAYEEVQLGVVSVEPLGGLQAPEGLELYDQCRRGCDYHVWYAYLCQCVGEPRLSEEGDVLGWYTRQEIIEELKLNKATGTFFTQLFGEEPRSIRSR